MSSEPKHPATFTEGYRHMTRARDWLLKSLAKLKGERLFPLLDEEVTEETLIDVRRQFDMLENLILRTDVPVELQSLYLNAVHIIVLYAEATRRRQTFEKMNIERTSPAVNNRKSVRYLDSKKSIITSVARAYWKSFPEHKENISLTAREIIVEVNKGIAEEHGKGLMDKKDISFERLKFHLKEMLFDLSR